LSFTRAAGDPLGIHRESEPTHDSFASQVRDALSHLHDPAYLQTHPLTRFLPEWSAGRRAVLGRALRQALLEAVESLQPAGDTTSAARHSRILSMRYVEGLDVRDIQAQLAVSRAQFYREHQTALEAVVSVLRARWGIDDGARREPVALRFEVDDLAQEHRLAVGPSQPRHNLPGATTSFVGREPEIAEVSRLLRGTRLLTLTGSGGSGKTRLALRVAADLPQAYPDGVWLVELAALTDPGLVPRTISFPLGLPEQPGISIERALLEYLKPRRLLLILDNCEHLIDSCARFVDSALRECPDVEVLATSREPLGVYGELTWRVPSLRVPAPGEALSVERLVEYESVRLLVERAQLAQPGFAVTEENADAVTQICHRLDGIPLAIELAAARLGVLSIEQIATRLNDRFRLLTGGSRTALRRQQTLWSTIEWSHKLLSEKEKICLRRLAVFSGGLTLEAAEAVCTGAEIEAGEVLDLLAGLVRKSLVVAEEVGGLVRYNLLETMRQYASEKLVDAEEAEATRNRHRDWYLALARRAAPELQRESGLYWLNRLETEHDNLRSVLAWCLESDVLSGLELVGHLYLFWDYHCHFREGRRWSTDMLARDAEPSLLRARALRTAGAMARGEGNFEAARRLLKESQRLCKALGNRRELGLTTLLLGTVSGGSDEAQALYGEALQAARETGDDILTSEALQYMGSNARQRGNRDEARRLMEESLVLARRTGTGHRVAWNILSLGELALEDGDRARARELLEESVAHFREERHGYGICIAQLLLGFVDTAEGDLGTARGRLGESLEIIQRIGSRTLVVRVLWIAGEIAVASGAYDAGARLFGVIDAERHSHPASYRLYQQDAERAAVATAQAGLGDSAFARAWAEGESTTTEEALELARQVQSG
jgi:predicted ATPase